MSKNKKNKKNATEKVPDKGFVDEQILSQAIVKAYFEIEAEKEEKAKAKAEKERKKVLNDFGQKEYPDNENAFKKFIHKRGNDFRLVNRTESNERLQSILWCCNGNNSCNVYSITCVRSYNRPAYSC